MFLDFNVKKSALHQAFVDISAWIEKKNHLISVSGYEFIDPLLYKSEQHITLAQNRAEKSEYLF